MRWQQCIRVSAVIAALAGCSRPPGQVARPPFKQGVRGASDDDPNGIVM